MSETARIKENQDALKASGLIEAAPAPTGVEVYERAMAKLDNEKVRARLEFKKGSTTPEKKTPEQIAALDAVLAHFTDIEAMPEGDEKTALVAEFKAANWELILRPEEIAVIRDQVDDRLKLKSDSLDQAGAPETVELTPAFLESNELKSPQDFAKDVMDWIGAPGKDYMIFKGGHGYRMSGAKVKNEAVIALTCGTGLGSEESQDPEWKSYRKQVVDALKGNLLQVNERDSVTQIKISLSENETPTSEVEGGMDAFIVTNGLKSPQDFAKDVMDLLIDPAKTDVVYKGGGYLVTANKNAERVQIFLSGTSELQEGDKQNPEWIQYRKAAVEALVAAGLKVNAKEMDLTTSQQMRGVTHLEITPTDFEGFVAPGAEAPQVETPEVEAPEPTLVLNEEGEYEKEPGVWVLPDAGTRLDGALSTGDALKSKWQEVGEAWRDGEYGAAFAALTEVFSLGISSLMERFTGITWEDVQNPVKVLKGVLEKPGETLDKLYEEVSGRISTLKFRTFGQIEASTASPGDKVAAAALLGVASNVDCANPSQNHCSGWVQTIAQKMGIDRYDKNKHAYVNPKNQTYHGWARGARNKSDLGEIGGLQPGDLIIFQNGNEYTDHHDGVVIDTKGDKVLLASQTATKGSSGTRQLQWRTIPDDKIAVVTRPGWSPSQPNS